jgi:hypothetical protein
MCVWNRDEPPAQQAQSPVDFLCQFTTNFTVAYQIAKCLIEADEDVPVSFSNLMLTSIILFALVLQFVYGNDEKSGQELSN